MISRKQTYLIAAVLWVAMFSVTAMILGFFVSRYGLGQVMAGWQSVRPAAITFKWTMMVLAILYWHELVNWLGQRFSWTEEQIVRVQTKRWHMLQVLIALELFLGQNILKRLFDALGAA
ncbi:MAG: hypothetical protein AB2807_09985 [Candidatus Sedimenticola endophacoides]